MRDQLPELIKVGDTSLRRAESPDRLRQLLSPFVRILVTYLFLILSEESLLLHQRIVYELVVEELVEDVELLDQELVEGVDDGAHDTDAVSLDTVKHLIHSNCFDLSCFLCSLNELLRVDVIIVFRDEFSKLTQHLQNIDSLLDLR